MDITIAVKNERIDVKVNRRQKIEDTMYILGNGGIIELCSEEGGYTVRSERNGEQINPKMSFKKANIFNGDILYLEV